MHRIALPDHAGSRDQAQELTSGLPKDLGGETIVLDCGSVVVGTPSFLDEIVKQVLVLRNASKLEVLDGPPRSRELLERAAQNRQVSSRLKLDTRRVA